jgi:hypothetical protein
MADRENHNDWRYYESWSARCVAITKGGWRCKIHAHRGGRDRPKGPPLCESHRTDKVKE